jgi:hypothetical protein
MQPYRGGGDAFVTKFNAAGSALVYSTYLGGSGADNAGAVAVDTAGYVFVAGATQSTDFPVASAFQPSHGGNFQDAFVSKIDPSGSTLLYSTYLGGNGNDVAFGVAVDSAGEAFLAGFTTSTNFPTASPIQGAFAGGGPDGLGHDAFVTKLSPGGSSLVYSTYLGGSSDDAAAGIALDQAGDAYAVGYTQSTDFPTASPFQAAARGYADGFVSEIVTSVPAPALGSYASWLALALLAAGSMTVARHRAVRRE